MSIFNLFGSKDTPPPRDPYSGFDAGSHYRPKLNIADFYRLSGFDFGWFTLEPLSDYIGSPENEAELGRHLSPAQKALYFWWYLDAQVTNGGFIQFYFNGYGKYVPAIISGLRLIGDGAMAEHVEKADAIYRKNIKLFENAWKDDLDGLSKLYDNRKVEKLNDFDSEYYDMNDDTMTAIEQYFRSHPDEVAIDENGNELDASHTGEIKTYHFNGNIKESFSMVQGKIEGLFSAFYENGNPKEKVVYKGGSPTGDNEDFFENGQTKTRVAKDEAKGISTEEKYHANGILKSRTFRSLETGERTGLYEEWHDNGQLAETGTYKGDYEREGVWLKFYSNGSKHTESEYRDKSYFAINYWGEDGTQLLTDGTGLLQSTYEDDVYEHEYKDYKRHGKQHTYTNGILRLYQEMENDAENGITRTYYNNGNLKAESVYKDGEKISEEKFRIYNNPKVITAVRCEMENEWLANRSLEPQDSNPVLKNLHATAAQINAPLAVFDGYDDDDELSCNYFVTVDESGRVIDYDFLYSSHGELNAITKPILNTLDFEPGIVTGNAVTSYINVEFIFTLGE